MGSCIYKEAETDIPNYGHNLHYFSYILLWNFADVDDY